MPKIIQKDENGFERIVFGEVLLPYTLNSHGDYHTPESIREFAYSFMVAGFGMDVQHDEVDRSDRIHVVESFIAREGDPEFIPHSWVLGVMVKDDDIWQQILDGDINGFSWQALARFLPIEITTEVSRTRFGVTEPDVFDGHTHEYFVILDANGRLLSGGTTETNGHTHEIRNFTSTENTQGHRHIFNIN